LRHLYIMEATILQPRKTTSDLSNLVGLIRIRGNDPTAATALSEAIEDWMQKTGWDRHLRILVEEGHDSEVALMPGEHQSNPEVRMAFRESPDFSKVRFRLEHWLYELM
jgi:hypothetical protein